MRVQLSQLVAYFVARRVNNHAVRRTRRSQRACDGRAGHHGQHPSPESGTGHACLPAGCKTVVARCVAWGAHRTHGSVGRSFVAAGRPIRPHVADARHLISVPSDGKSPIPVSGKQGCLLSAQTPTWSDRDPELDPIGLCGEERR